MKHLVAGFSALAILTACTGEQAEPTAPEVETEAAAEILPRFTVEVTGEGPDIILIPGLASHPETFATTVEQLQDRFTLHSVHVAGFAGAPAAGNDGETDILLPLASEINRYAEGLSDKPSVIGHSLGGLTALITTVEHPETFDKVMVIDVLPFFSVLIDPETDEDAIAPTAAFLKSTLLSQPDEVYEIRQREALAALTKSEEALEKSLQWSLATDRNVMAEAMHDVLTTDLRDKMSGLAAPLTVLYARDPAIPNMDRAEQQFLDGYSPVPDVNITPVDGALHFVMYDQPDAYAAAVETFVTDIE